MDFSQRSKPATAPPPARTPAPPSAAKADPRAPQQPAKDNPKIESVLCYPAPDEAGDEAKEAGWVMYQDVARDDSGRIVKMQRIRARELVMKAKGDDQQVEAYGPGTVRLWRWGWQALQARLNGTPVRPVRERSP